MLIVIRNVDRTIQIYSLLFTCSLLLCACINLIIAYYSVDLISVENGSFTRSATKIISVSIVMLILLFKTLQMNWFKMLFDVGKCDAHCQNKRCVNVMHNSSSLPFVISFLFLFSYFGLFAAGM